MAGVIVFGVREGQFCWARFYLEPVEASGAGVTETVRQRVQADAAPLAASDQRDAAEAPSADAPPTAAGPADRARP
jgi:hypothetical protein